LPRSGRNWLALAFRRISCLNFGTRGRSGTRSFQQRKDRPMNSQFNVIAGERVPIKAWTRGVQVEDAAEKQLRNIANMPFIHKHVAAMPDVHWGMGATVGSVIATRGAIIPAAVGVDIGCGMAAVRTNLTANDLPDSLSSIRSEIEAAIPHGRTD